MQKVEYYAILTVLLVKTPHPAPFVGGFLLCVLSSLEASVTTTDSLYVQMNYTIRHVWFWCLISVYHKQELHNMEFLLFFTQFPGNQFGFNVVLCGNETCRMNSSPITDRIFWWWSEWVCLNLGFYLHN